ncbi:TRADD-N-associated membrane domain-containing protein [Nocardia asteroides]|uniref:TRADD-N-associated membrane domain-containing protein n=1 Tax=Nocardia asteroides TaxID=1824 RepID=UPI001E345387|nr:hypothetical protein [Nocardia asteroides]UGT57137.1 hypothetical protein LTT85_09935 [Nocardia asteroides]
MSGVLPVELLAAGSTTAGAAYAAALQLLDARRARHRVQQLSTAITKEPAAEPEANWLEAAARERSELDIEHHHSALQQQRLATIASLVCGVIAIGVVMYGLIGGDTADPEGLATVAAGLLPGAASALLFWQSRSASLRADKFAERIATTAARAEALRHAGSILDTRSRDRFATAVLLSTAFPELTGREIWRMAESGGRAGDTDRAGASDQGDNTGKTDAADRHPAPPPS